MKNEIYERNEGKWRFHMKENDRFRVFCLNSIYLFADSYLNFEKV